MRKNNKIFASVVVLTFLVALGGTTSALSGQTTSGQVQGSVQQTSDQAKAEAQAQDLKARQEKEILAAQARVELERQKAAAERAEMELIVKTYSLKYINASDFMRSAKFYVYDSSGTETTLTVRIPKKNIPDFEALLKKLDVEKKNIQFQVYAIVASKDDLPESYQSYLKSETKEIADRDLKKVLDEMKGLWNFKHYWVETPSFMIAKDGAASNHAKLVSRHDFEFYLRNVQLRGEESGKRIISVGEIRLIQSTNTSNGKSEQNLIDTSNITFKEKGYLVVGVSGLQTGWSGAALILVISAEIK
jgi:hypothetical protein